MSSAGDASGAPPREHREELLVRSYEVEPDGRLRLVVLLRMLQEAAWQHAQMLGKGFTSREAGELFWVLSRLRLRMDRYPRWGERFTIRTFPVGTEKILAVREFTVLSEAGEVLGRASSGWLIVDGATGRPVRPQPVVADIVTTSSEYDGGLARVEPLPDGDEALLDGPRVVRYHDIDQYRHVNNASYVEWVLDAEPPARALTAEVAELGVDFLRETLPDDRYVVAISPASADRDAFEVRRLAGAGVAAAGVAAAGGAGAESEAVGGAAAEPAARGYLVWRAGR